MKGIDIFGIFDCLNYNFCNYLSDEWLQNEYRWLEKQCYANLHNGDYEGLFALGMAECD